MVCIRRYPARLEQEVVQKMRDFYESEKYGYMPVCSLALKARRDGSVNANITTWYRYARRLGWHRPLSKKIKNCRRTVGIRARRVHQVWHVDVTEISSKDGEKLFLALVLDNFSRAVLSWSLDEKKSQETSEKILEEALAKFGKKKASVLEIVSDGGSENLILKKITDGVLVQHKIAGKEINHPNTMIEAFFRSMKSDYLSRIELADKNAVIEAVNFYIERHNSEIPRKSLNGLTPHEVMSGKQGLPMKNLLPNAADRVEVNRAIDCRGCWMT